MALDIENVILVSARVLRKYVICDTALGMKDYKLMTIIGAIRNSVDK